MTKRNPKQEGSNLFDCKPQSGLCPLGCNQCFYNRPGAFYVPIDEPHMPAPEEVGAGIVRVNAGHDSNIQRELVIQETAQYPRRFFNTSRARFDFPGPVVFTANREEEAPAAGPPDPVPVNLMFVRLRISTTNLYDIDQAVEGWTRARVPIVLTFMAYYDREPKRTIPGYVLDGPVYEWKVRHVNSYWCATRPFMAYVLCREKEIGGRLVTMCGTLDSNYCRDCRNCEIYYWQTIRHMREQEHG